jgi:hypothetical protein
VGAYLREPEAICEIRSRSLTAAEGEGEIAPDFSRYRRPTSAAFARAAALEVDRELQHIE